MSLFVARLRERELQEKIMKTKQKKGNLSDLNFFDIYLSDSPKPEPGRGAYTLGSLPFLQQS